MQTVGIAVHKRLVLGYGLLRQLLVQVVVGRLVVFARGRQIQSLLRALAVGETLEKALELVARRVIVLVAVHQRHGIVPRDILGVLLPVVVHNQILEQLGGAGVASLVVVFYRRLVLRGKIVPLQQLVITAARGCKGDGYDEKTYLKNGLHSLQKYTFFLK